MHIFSQTHVDSKDATGTTQHDRFEKAGLLLLASGGQNGRGDNGRGGREGTEVVVHHVEVATIWRALFLDLQVLYAMNDMLRKDEYEKCIREPKAAKEAELVLM